MNCTATNFQDQIKKNIISEIKFLVTLILEVETLQGGGAYFFFELVC